MRSIKTNLNQYLNRFDAFRDRSFSFQISLIVLLTVVFSFAASRCWQLAQEEKQYPGLPHTGITAGIGILNK